MKTISLFTDYDSMEDASHNPQSDWVKDSFTSDYHFEPILMSGEGNPWKTHSIFEDYNQNYFLKRRDSAENIPYEVTDDRWRRLQDLLPEDTDYPYHDSHSFLSERRIPEPFTRNIYGFIRRRRDVANQEVSSERRRSQTSSSNGSTDTINKIDTTIAQEYPGHTLSVVWNTVASPDNKTDGPRDVNKTMHGQPQSAGGGSKQNVGESEIRVRKRAAPKSKFDRYLGGMGLGKRSQIEEDRQEISGFPFKEGDRFKWGLDADKRAGGKSKFDRYIGGMGLGKRSLAKDDKSEMLGLPYKEEDRYKWNEDTKRAGGKSKFDRYLGGMGLGKRVQNERNRQNIFSSSLKGENKNAEEAKRAGNRSKFDRYLGGMGLGKRNQIEEDKHYIFGLPFREERNYKWDLDIKKRAGAKSKFDRYLGGMGLGKRSQVEEDGDEIISLPSRDEIDSKQDAEVNKRAGSKSKFDRYLGGMGLGKRNEKTKPNGIASLATKEYEVQREVNVKRAGPKSKFDRYLGGMGLGKRNQMEDNNNREYVLPQTEGGNVRWDVNTDKRGGPKTKFDRYLGGMGLGKRNQMEDNNNRDFVLPQTEDENMRLEVDPDKKRGGPKTKFDRYLGGMGLGKRSKQTEDNKIIIKEEIIEKRSIPKSKFDRYLGGMGLGKRRFNPYSPEYALFLKKSRSASNRRRYDPMWSKMGIGKRNLEEDLESLGLKKRQRPKYDPGWKFIGLGKRDVAMLRPQVSKFTNPYFGILALSNLTDYFNNLKKELRSEKTEKVATNSMLRSENKSHDPLKLGSLVYVRDRKPSVKIGSQPRSIYDPAWRLTGLGR